MIAVKEPKISVKSTIRNSDKIAFRKVGSQVVLIDKGKINPVSEKEIKNLKDRINASIKPTRIYLQGLSRAQAGQIVQKLREEDVNIIGVKKSPLVSKNGRRYIVQHELIVR